MRQLVLIDDDIREFTSLSRFDLLLHRLEAPLHPINADRNAIDERERLRVFGEHRREYTANGHDDADDWLLDNGRHWQ